MSEIFSKISVTHTQVVVLSTQTNNLIRIHNLIHLHLRRLLTSLISWQSPINGRVSRLSIDIYAGDMLNNNKHGGLFNFSFPEQFFFFILY